MDLRSAIAVTEKRKRKAHVGQGDDLAVNGLAVKPNDPSDPRTYMVEEN